MVQKVLRGEMLPYLPNVKNIFFLFLSQSLKVTGLRGIVYSSFLSRKENYFFPNAEVLKGKMF